MPIVIYLLIALSFAATPFARAGEGAWTGNGPDGGSIGELLVDPATPATLYAGTVGDLFKSIDSGSNWTRAQDGLGGFVDYGYVQALLVDPSTSTTLYAVGVGGSLFVSHDGAGNWAPTGYAPAAGDSIASLAKAPGVGGALYVGTAVSGVKVSHDGGTMFTSIGTGLPAGMPISTLTADPSHPGVLLAYVLGTGIYRSSDDGLHWSLVQATAGYTQLNDFSFGAGARVYLAAGSLYRSDDAGVSWTATPSNGYGIVAAHPTVANLVYFVDDSRRARMSTDGGDSSTDISAGAVMANGTDPASIDALAIAPTAAGVQYVHAGTADAGVFRRTSAGAWSATNLGLRASNIRALAPHPTMGGRVLAGIADASSPSPAIYVSTDSAGSWSESNSGLRAQDIRSLTYDPTSTATAAGGIVYATGRGSLLDSYPVNAGLFKSTNGGAAWTELGNGLPAPPGGTPDRHWIGLVRSFAIDPGSCASPPAGTGSCTSGPLRTLYATASGREGTSTFTWRLVKSVDAGANWTNIDGLPVTIDFGDPTEQTVIPVPLVIDPLHPQRLYVGTYASVDSTVVPTPGIANGVFRSDDGGATWNLRSNGLPLHTGSSVSHLDVLSLAIDPVNTDVLWASAYDVLAAPAGYSHIYKTVDGGANWSDSSNGISAGDIRQLIVDPANPAIVYAAATGYRSNPAGVYKSRDGGATWRSISAGMENAGPSSVAIDPTDPSTLYAGTPSGVWSLHQLADSDADGVPDVVEQAGPNGGDANADGIPDYLQANVASVATSVSTAGQWTIDAAAPANAGSYFSVSVVPAVNGTCSQAVDVQAIDPALRPADFDAGVPFAYPLSLTRFELLDCPAADVMIHFSDANFTAGSSFRYYGPATPGNDAGIGWHALASIAQRVDAHTWKLHLVAGAFGSYRPASANSILFEGGPGYSDRVFANGFDD